MLKPQIDIRIKKIKEESYTFKNLDPKQIEDFDANLLSVMFNMRFEINEKENQFIIFPRIIYKYRLDNIDVELLNVVCLFEYYISNLENIYKKLQDNKFFMPDEIMQFIVDATIHSMRGVIAVKTGGNFLTNYPLPLHSTDAFTKELVTEKKKAISKKRISKKPANKR